MPFLGDCRLQKEVDLFENFTILILLHSTIKLSCGISKVTASPWLALLLQQVVFMRWSCQSHTYWFGIQSCPSPSLIANQGKRAQFALLFNPQAVEKKRWIYIFPQSSCVQVNEMLMSFFSNWQYTVINDVNPISILIFVSIMKIKQLLEVRD